MTSGSAGSGTRVAIIGMGPRGISVLERIAVHAANTGRRVHVLAIDRTEVGAGRVWRTGQPDWFAMNTVAGQVTMYSADRDGGPDRPGHGPSLAEWLAERPDPRLAAIGPDGYAPRAAYGHYLREVYGNLLDRLPAGMSVESVTGHVEAVRLGTDGTFSVEIASAAHTRTAWADHVVLATGHPLIDPAATMRDLGRHAARHPQLRLLAGDSAADMPLDSIGPGETVGVIGLGLSFYDVLLTLTVGRGGRFEETERGLRYVPGGGEPRVVAGSRSGLPIPARGVNQKASNHVHSAVVFTADRVRAHRDETDGADAPLNFRRHVMPFIQAEIDHRYLTLLVRDTLGPAPSERFAELHAKYLENGQPTGPLRRSFGLPGDATLDLEALARPFAGRTFTDPQHFRAALLSLLRADIAEAKRGTLNGPIKAALDVLRDIRNTVRDLVDFGGLDPASRRDDFENWYVPINALLSAGPPLERSEQLIALIEADVVTVIGPRARFTAARQRFVLSSPDVFGARVEATALVDARIPQPNLRYDRSPLYRQLLADGIAREFVVPGVGGHAPYPTGGLDVTRAPYRVIDRSGRAVPGLYALGLPTEHVRWFNQIGNGRPGLKTLFLRDADAIAEAIIAAPAAQAAAVKELTAVTPIATADVDTDRVAATAH